jgi:hypothetical protein
LNRGFDGGLLFITVPGRQDFLQLVKRIERPGVYGIQVHFPRAAWSESYFEAVKAHAERNGLSIFETQVTGESPLRFLIVEFGKDPDAAHDFVQYVLREVFSANEKRGSLCAWKTQTSEMYSLIGSHEVAPQGEEELGVSLEWCNTDTEADVRAFDASGRPLRSHRRGLRGAHRRS